MKKSKENFTLLITGCIFPTKNVFCNTLKNPEERKKQYIESIRFYLEKTEVKNVVFCENSGVQDDSHLSEIASKFGKNFEWLTFIGNQEKIAEHGKGYGELEIVDYAVKNSKLLSKCNTFIKVTGRLKLVNIDKTRQYLDKNKNYFALSHRCFDVRSYLVTKDFYVNYLSKCKDLISDSNGYYLEHAFYDIAKKYKNDCSVFSFYLNFIGISGSTGIKYREKRGVNMALANIKEFFKWLRWTFLNC